MSVDFGIIGLAGSGKTTVYNALVSGKATTESRAPANVGVTKVPEPRLAKLASILHPNRVVPVEVKYTDIGAASGGTGKERGLSPQLLGQLSNVDALIEVVRVFRNESVPHPDGSLDIHRDIASMNLELSFSDLAIIERRLEKIGLSLKGAKAPERQAFLHEEEMLANLKNQLEKGSQIREMQLTPEEVKALANYQFLTAKPMLIVVNIDEGQVAQMGVLEAELNTRYSRPRCRVITLCAKLEWELTQLDEEAARSFRAEYGIQESGLERTIKASFELLGLVSFFTIASNEVRAWPVAVGTPAVKAAGKIHTDMEKGFIRAEVVSYNDLVRVGSLAQARNQGLLRLEGKNYVVQDGDVITFLFNV